MQTPRIKTLSAPVRVYWSLTTEGTGGLPPELAANVAGELAGMRAFFVTLSLTCGQRDDLAAIISALKKGVASVAVSIGDTASFPDASLLSGVDAVGLAPGDADSLAVLLRLADGISKPVTLSVVPEKTNAAFIATLMQTGLAHGIKAFMLPNPDILGGREYQPFIIDEPARAEIKGVVEGLLKPHGDVKLFVHDLFLHKALELPGLGARIEYAGCQAGDAIVYIGRDGVVYPCATMPVPLGDLHQRGLGDIWKDHARVELRERIQTQLAGCAGCSVVADCKGGCRGMAWVADGTDAPDPACGYGAGE